MPAPGKYRKFSLGKMAIKLKGLLNIKKNASVWIDHKGGAFYPL
jgi:hypothetical protein